jgi:hypothetical protein
MNVPNNRIGFSKLPENVQQRMDPSLAKKYQMGGSVMQRPLFRQMGGPAQMMPQDMPPPPMGGAPMAPPPMPPPPMDPMAEQMMAAESMGQSAGEDVANAMMMQIDGAEDYESLIDGIRGNELPLDARYQELAGFVGEADAMATPESVLAMTQPTIMMTEQGAVDSGIGELMQGIAGEVDMSGPMDDGVGSLMAAGAGNTPPVNFRNGGPVEVRGYAGETPGGTPTGEVRVGGGAPLSIIEQAKLNAPAYQAYLSSAMDSKARAADLEEQKRMSQAQMLFDIAGAGLAFAGETQGGTAAERLANALTRTQLTDKIGARSAGILDAKRAQAAEDRQLRMAGLQAGLGAAQTENEKEFQIEQNRLTREAAALNVKPGDTFSLKDKDGKELYRGPVGSVREQRRLLEKFPNAVLFEEVIPPPEQKASTRFNMVSKDGTKTEMVNVGTPEGLKREAVLRGEGYTKGGLSDADAPPVARNEQLYVNQKDPTDTKVFDLNDPADVKKIKELGSDYLPVTMPSMSDVAEISADPDLGGPHAKFFAIISDEDNLRKYADGTLKPYLANLINNYITDKTTLKSSWNDELGKTEFRPGLRLSNSMEMAIKLRSQIKGASLPKVGGVDALSGDKNAPNGGRIQFDENGNIDFSVFEGDNTNIITGVNLANSQGFMSTVNRVANAFMGQLKDVMGLGSGYGGEEGRITSQADPQLVSLANKIVRTGKAGANITEGGTTRIFSQDVDMLVEEVKGFRPGGAKTDNGARDQLVVVRRMLAMMYSDAQSILVAPEFYNETDVQEARRLQRVTENLIAETTAAISIYDKYIENDPIGDAVGDRSGASITSTLQRAGTSDDDEGEKGK